MLKNTLKVITALTLAITFTSCGGHESNTKVHAEKLCDCMEEVGLDDSMDASDLQDRKKMREIERKAEKVMPKCALETLKEMEKEMDDMTKTEKKEYTKAFLKNVIDTECSDRILQEVPYDMMGMLVNQLEKAVEYSEERMNR